MNYRPLQNGVGVQSPERLTLPGYEESQRGPVWQYRVTPKGWRWPRMPEDNRRVVIDGFSPNLNKSLHCGHLRQLALANCLSKCMPTARFVALLGCHGILKKAQDELKDWMFWLGYDPRLYYDVLMPQDEDIVPRREVTEGEYAGTLVWDGPEGPVVVFRKPDDTGHRRATYAFHDLAFAATVKPDHYLTGSEQIGHFKALGLADKHLSMGLVVGKDGKKLASRSGDAFLAEEAIQTVIDMLAEVPNPRAVAWNVLAYNMLATGRAQNVKFDPEVWVRPEASGLYINYTWARLNAALDGPEGVIRIESEMTQTDAELAGFADQWHYHLQKTQATLCPAGFANWLAELCRRASRAYHSERIRGGRPGFQFAMFHCLRAIEESMVRLGMMPVPLREE